jgi:hypothetical protein
MPLTRRELLKTGAAGVALLSLADCARSAGFAIGASQRDVVLKIADAMLDGALPVPAVPRAAALAAAADGFAVAVAGLPPDVQNQVGQIFGLLTFAPTRRLVAGLPPWQRATRAEVAQFLDGWRFSGFALLRSAYDALHQLVMAGWYGQNEAWPRIGYPGPPEIA